MAQRGNERDSDALAPIEADAFGVEQARRLLWRAGFGGAPEDVARLAAMGPQGAVDHLLNYNSIEYEAPGETLFDGDIIVPLTREQRQKQQNARAQRDQATLDRFREMRQAAQKLDRQQMREVQRWWLTRMIETPRPLEEKMTLFWHSLLASSHAKVRNSYHMYTQNQLFRAHAVKSYAHLLFAIIQDPAMIAYLDNQNSSQRKPNENLARELMELFSLGVGNYTEKDIKEGARALTGYSFRHNEFNFRRGIHDSATKSILGSRGGLDGEGFVRAILNQPACATYVSWRLHRFFVDSVPETLDETPAETKLVVEELAKTLRRSDYKVGPVLRRLFLSRHFYSEANEGALIKSPVELVIGACRSLGAPIRQPNPVIELMGRMGQTIFFPPSVAGWEGGRGWINTTTLMARQNALALLVGGAGNRRRRPGVDARALLGGDTSDPRRVVGSLLERTLAVDARSVAGDRRKTLEAHYAQRAETNTNEAIIGTLLLITALPEHQLC